MKLCKLALIVTSLILSTNLSAALTGNSVLVFNPSQYICSAGGTYPNCDFGVTEINVNGSWSGLDLQNDGVIDPADRAAIIPGSDGGIVLGETQSFGEIEQPWLFLGISSSYYTTSPIVVVNDLGLTKELDFSGWMFNRSGFLFPLGGQTGSGDTGLASITCETVLCASGELFTLDYSAHLPADFDTGYEGMLHELHLVGTISSVPVPAAVWLFGSGLVGLVGFARRK